MALLLLSAFLFGGLTVVVMEAIGLWILIRFLNRKVERGKIKAKDASSVSSPCDLNPSLPDKQGAVWVLVPDKIPKLGLEKKEILEVTPARKYARIRDDYLNLMESDGSCVEILLRGCEIVAVSATSLASRKWAKRYPIKVERKDPAIYRGHKIIYIYLETSWDKESWCKALRLASCNDKEKIAWFSKLNVEFHCYLASLNTGYPSFAKPSGSSNTELMDKSAKLDNSSSKVRQFLKKITKKASKAGQDYKATGASISNHEDRNTSQKSHSFQDLFLINDLAKMDIAGKVSNMFSDDGTVPSSVSTIETGIENNLPRISDADSIYKCHDEGTLCANVLISRLFFDVKNSLQIKTSILNRIQRALSNMRIPSYIGEVACTAVHPGNLPPHILAMRVLPSNMNEIWSLEVDLEYLGGMVLDFETRLEIRELERGETSFGLNNNGEVTSDLLEGFQYLGEQLKLSGETPSDIKQKDEKGHGKDKVEKSKGNVQAPSQGSRWKSILHSISRQVSQVPLSLGIKVSSLNGTMRLCMKPPPSDHIWFGFTSMPDIQCNVESFVGDHKITNGHIALFLNSRIKAAIRETLVLPNSESVGISWMLAEKDDWVPRKSAPFMWHKNSQDSNNPTAKGALSSFPGEANSNRNASTLPTETMSDEKSRDAGGCIPEAAGEYSHTCASPSSSIDELTEVSFRETKAPSINDDKLQELGVIEEKPDKYVNSPSRIGQMHNSDDEETRMRRIGTRERMRGLGKKVGEKLEYNRRHLEEKGRNFVERMRGPS